MTQRPLIAVEGFTTEFGHITADPKFYDESVSQDFSHVPGFSDLRRARDREIARLVATKKYTSQEAARKAPELPVNMRWARCTTVRNEPDNRKVTAHGNRGYRLVTQADIGTPWLKAMPIGSLENPDGTVRRGDMVLMVCTKEQAARNEAVKQFRTEQLQQNAPALAGGLLTVGERVQDAKPFVVAEK